MKWRWPTTLPKERREQLLILLLAGILLLVVSFPGQSSKRTQSDEAHRITFGASPAASDSPVLNDTDSAAPGSTDEAARLETRLQQLLSHVSGVGGTEVMITLKSDGRRLVEKDETARESHSSTGDNSVRTEPSEQEHSSTTVYQRDSEGNEIPYVTEHAAPEISGVLVIAQGGGNPRIVREITEAAMALFGVEMHKIKVMKME